MAEGVTDFLGCQVTAETQNTKFAGVFSTGLNAGDFHHVSPEEVRKRLKAATEDILKAGSKITCVVMGCGGMAGLEEIIRDTTEEYYGSGTLKRFHVVDGVKAGMIELQKTLQCRVAFG